jgi:hypothetical protein
MKVTTRVANALANECGRRWRRHEKDILFDYIIAVDVVRTRDVLNR